ncbi:MAG: aminotransferase class V-fold PLP-dependent enzyme [Hyphomonadaceae bacterium]|nr:aminotransferase class V-fold PLP-dependent enzyme [Hyphomonadaceae bacterium]
MKSYKHLFSRALAAAPSRLHFAAHSHHLWPDASYDGHMAAWDDAAALADRKWETIFGAVIPEAQAHIANELRLPDPPTIAFAPNTHELLVRLVSARSERPITMLTTDGEFHSFRRQSARWEEAGVVQRRVVPCAPFETFDQRFIEAARALRPHLVFLSHVMFRSGLRFDAVEDLASLANPDGMWVALDLYHSFMAIPCDFARVADRVFLLGGGYKYAMAGEGAGFLHAPPGFAGRPQNTGWFADFGAIEAKQGEVAYGRDGSRFLGATFDATGLYRFNAVRAMLAAEALDTATISDRIAQLQTQLIEALRQGDAGVLAEGELLRPNAVGPYARFLSLRHPSAVDWKSRLMAANVITDARDDILRIGVGLYHDEADIGAFCAAATQALA